MQRQNKTYHQMVAQNFLRNISLDGSHEDTSLRIFKDHGLHFTLRHRDLSFPAPVQPTNVSEEDLSSVFDPELAESRGDIPYLKLELQQRRQRLGLHKSLDNPEIGPSAKRTGKGSMDAGQQKGRRKKHESFRSRLGSVGSDFDSSHRHRHWNRRPFESSGEGGKVLAP